MKTVKLFKQGNALCITIPFHLRAVMKWVKGDLIVVERVEDSLVLSHVKSHIAGELRREAAAHTSKGDASGARS